ncbi:branched-chain amino acid aminotransferase [Halorhabdus utahensis DSM 12940]|uniref:Branched-chain-amino-acid aminotransferase n=2 Tax=Halorhabdus utahensis TaxID=146826 RepID=C7NSH9_HALUD|nr:branched-chain amino acid aminotransferase [Halorhabdus utahensis DSM 12940]
MAEITFTPSGFGQGMSDGTMPTGFEAKREASDTLDTIWMDGEFIPWEDATIHVLSHALHYGTSVFEGVRCYETADGPALFRWDAHLDRLYNSAAMYDLDIGFDREELTTATLELLARQDLGGCYVRPIAFYGYDRLGVSPTTPTKLPERVAIAAWPWESYLGESALEDGIDAGVSSWRKYGHDQIPPTAKTTGAYVNGVLATDEAARNGYDEAIVLNSEGNVAEGPGENLFLVDDGEIYTPGLAEDALDGITRQSVIELAREAGYTVHDDARIGRGELYTADELFFTGTAAEVTPIRSVDDRAIGAGSKGPVTDDLQTRFFDLVSGPVDTHEAWFTRVH